MNKSIYEQAFIYTNDAEWWCDKACYWLGLDISERDQDYDIANKLDEIRKSLHNAQKQEKLLQLYRRLVNQNLQVNLHILEKIKELENE